MVTFKFICMAEKVSLLYYWKSASFKNTFYLVEYYVYVKVVEHNL